MTTIIPRIVRSPRYDLVATQDRIAKQLNSTGQPSSSIGSNNQHSDSSISSNVHHRFTTTCPIRPRQRNSHVRRGIRSSPTNHNTNCNHCHLGRQYTPSNSHSGYGSYSYHSPHNPTYPHSNISIPSPVPFNSLTVPTPTLPLAPNPADRTHTTPLRPTSSPPHREGTQLFRMVTSIPLRRHRTPPM